MANFKNYIIQQMDVKFAFLHVSIGEDIYLIIPEGFEEIGKIGKLDRVLYGLKQATYCWNKLFDKFAETEHLIKSNNGPCLYIRFTDHKKRLYLLLYADDIILVSNDDNSIPHKNHIKSLEIAEILLYQIHIYFICCFS